MIADRHDRSGACGYARAPPQLRDDAASCGQNRDGSGTVLRRAELVCHCLLIETAEGLVRVDTGSGSSDVISRNSLPLAYRLFVNPVLDYEETALRQVERLGFDPSDVRHIVVTHLDADHAGGLADFPNAKVHVHGTELRAAKAAGAPWRYRPAHWAHRPDWVSYAEASGQDWFGFDAVRELRGLPEDEILLVPLAGHTRGHVGVAVRGEDRWLLHAGDAYFFHAEMAPKSWCTPG